VEVKAVQNGDQDLALKSTKWSAIGVDTDGQPLTMSGNTVEVVRRQPDGTWLFVIDNPRGAN
jgi:ketosteroid isomerase-like protein